MISIFWYDICAIFLNTIYPEIQSFSHVMTLQEIEWQQYEFSVKFQLHTKNPFGNEPLICTADCHVCRSWRLGLPRELFNNLRHIIIEESWIPFEKIMLSASMAFWAHRPGGWGWVWVGVGGGYSVGKPLRVCYGLLKFGGKMEFWVQIRAKKSNSGRIDTQKDNFVLVDEKIPPKHRVQSSEGQKKGVKTVAHTYHPT